MLLPSNLVLEGVKEAVATFEESSVDRFSRQYVGEDIDDSAMIERLLYLRKQGYTLKQRNEASL